MSNKGGRPSKYNNKTLSKVMDYLEHFEEEGQVIPTVAGLAVHLDVNRDTLYAWAQDEDKAEFSDILGKLKSLQEIVLVNNGLSGDFNSVITKMMLTKHGYSDKVDVVTDGESINNTKSNADLAREIMFAMQTAVNKGEDGND